MLDSSRFQTCLSFYTKGVGIKSSVDQLQVAFDGSVFLFSNLLKNWSEIHMETSFVMTFE